MNTPTPEQAAAEYYRMRTVHIADEYPFKQGFHAGIAWAREQRCNSWSHHVECRERIVELEGELADVRAQCAVKEKNKQRCYRMYDELEAENIRLREVLGGVANGLIEHDCQCSDSVEGMLTAILETLGVKTL